MAKAKLWISWLAGVVVFLEVMGGTVRLKSLFPEFSGQRRTKNVLFRREPLIVMNSTTSNTTKPSNNISSSNNNSSSSSPAAWRSPRHLTGSWIGDSWIPPSPEWRLYSAREMRDIFHGQRIAFVGDSLARRAAMTLFPILNHTTMGGSTVLPSQHQQQHPLEEDIPRHWLDNPRDLTLNKASKKQEPCREHQWNGKHSPRICRTVISGGGDGEDSARDEESGILESTTTTTTTDQQTRSIETTTTTTTTTTTAIQPFGKVWQIWDPCFPDLLDWFQKELRGITNVTEGLDIVVVAAGIHDVQANPNCHRNKTWRPTNMNTSSYYEELTQVVLARLDVLLQTLLELQRAKPHLTIVWKTCGYSAVTDDTAIEKQRLVDRINERTMDILDQQQQQSIATSATGGDTMNATRTILYFDWGSAVKARSFGDARISGDSINHYGLQARLVALQMLTNVVASAALHVQRRRREPW